MNNLFEMGRALAKHGVHDFISPYSKQGEIKVLYHLGQQYAKGIKQLVMY